jgi:hypothetical protein
MSETPHGDGAAAVVNGAGLRDVTRKSYRYLRVAVVALALLLGISLVLEIVWGGRERFGSISGYYYSPVRSIFVGALVAIGPALVSIKGRAGWEDTMLDLAGMLAPVVALVPTPLPGSRDDVDCAAGVARCIPPEYTASVENNIAALAILGLVALAFAWFSAGQTVRREPSTRYGLAAAVVTWAVFVVVFLAARDVFMSVAHYAAAIPFFLLIAAVAYLNGRRAPERQNVSVISPDEYGRAYRTISGLMIATLLLTGGYYGVTALTGTPPWFAMIFVVEAVLLVLFVVFWVLQTAENWREEAVAEQAAAGEDVATT